MRRRRRNIKAKRSSIKNIIDTLSSISESPAPSLRTTEKDMQDLKTSLEETLVTLDSAENNGRFTNNVLKGVSLYLFLKLIGVNE